MPNVVTRKMNMNNEEELNKRRAIAFCKEKLPVHITKLSGIFYNGLILKVDEEFFTIDDQEDGAKVIFFFELKKPIVEFEEVGE